MYENLRGVSPVLQTPFLADDGIDEKGFQVVVDALVRSGVRSMMFPGFVSEFYKLTDDERQRLITLLLEQTRPGSGVSSIISISDHSTPVAVRRAVAAVEGEQARSTSSRHISWRPLELQ
jgi:dihydrodipicolinate synthase/N-acetylneuraminate lyase